MSLTWLVAVHHFRREVFKRSYLLTLFSLPLFVAFVITMGRIGAAINDESYRVGVVDPGGFIRTLEVPDADDDVVIHLYDSEEQALAALEDETDPIDGVYLLPPDYPENRNVELVVRENLDFQAQNHFAELLQTNLLTAGAPELVERVIEGGSLLIRATESNREFPASNPTAGLFMPVIGAVIYVFTLFPIAGIMAGALGDEKVNRTIEVLITTISTRQLLGGKILAVTLMALLQITTWTLFLALAVWIGAEGFDLPWLQNLAIPWRDVGAVALLAVPGFFFYGATLVLIGSLIDDAETLQQVSGLISIPLFFPLYVLPILISEPDGTLSQVFALLPITSVLTVGLQSIFREVPAGLLAASAGISVLSGLGMVWLAARAFRIGMLRYGKRIRLRELLGRGAAVGRLP